MNLPALTMKLAALAVAGVLSASALVGCGASTVSSSAGSAATTTSISTSATVSSTAGITSAATAASATNTVLKSGTVTVTVGDQTVTLSGAYVVDGVDATIDGGTYESAVGDQAVFLVVNGGHLTITNASISKTGDTASEENSNFYGTNAAVLVVGSSSSATVTNTTITTKASGANAVFATVGASATVKQSTIETYADSSRGLDGTYAGSITGESLAIHTRGQHCAALATDRGNGTVRVTGTNAFTTEGDGSPLVYSTGDISVSGLTGVAQASEVAVIEGKNKATITDSVVTSNGAKAIMLYQSFSGDAADGDATASVSTFVMKNTKLIANGATAVLYVTNTKTQATFTNVTIASSASVGVQAAEDRWGTSGSNGGRLTLTLDGTTITGGATASTNSTITVSATNGGALQGSTSGSVTVG